jgi:hypothetical protein
MPENFDVAAGVVTNIFTDNPDAPIDTAVQLGIPERLVVGLVKDQILDIESPISEAIVYFLVNIIQNSIKDSTEGASPEFIYSMLLMSTLDWDDELHDEILAAVVTLLSNNGVQLQIVLTHSNLLLETAEDVPEQIMDRVRTESPLLAFIALFQAETARLVPPPPNVNNENFTETGEDEAALLRSLYTLQNAAGDIASSLTYRDAKEMICDPVIQYFKDVTREDCILTRSLESSLAFLFLGNVARDAKTCVELVRIFDFHERAISLIGVVGKRFCEARYLAVGFLYNLANADQNKAIICVSAIINHLMNPEFQEGLNDGLRLLQAVVRKSPQHCRWLLYPPADVPECLVRMSHLEKWLPTMTPANTIEVARLIVTILRTLQWDKHCSDLSPDTFMTQAFANCLLTLTEQGVRSPLSSEGILGLALASQTPASARLVLHALRADFQRFIKAVEDGTEDGTPVAKENLENALVVLAKVKEHCPSDFDDVMMPHTEELLPSASDFYEEVQNELRELTARIHQKTLDGMKELKAVDEEKMGDEVKTEVKQETKDGDKTTGDDKTEDIHQLVSSSD